MARIGDGGDLLKCSFCGKSQKQVKKLIAGPGVYICDECVGLCDEILADNPLPAFKSWDDLPDEELLAEMVRIHASHRPIDRAVSTVVQRLRSRDVTWARVGEALGMTRQSAWERFSGEE
ncbi:MAG: hypothetical protein GEV12_09575 [Micromonosporaceae bacterium]|nr:hypothetical protein [Micromonosporaceae bacterium]